MGGRAPEAHSYRFTIPTCKLTCFLCCLQITGPMLVRSIKVLPYNGFDISLLSCLLTSAQSSKERPWCVELPNTCFGRLQAVLALLRRMSAYGLCATTHNIRWGMLHFGHV